MEIILKNHLDIPVSTLLLNDQAFAKDISTKLIRDLRELDIHTWEQEEYMKFDSTVEDWCDNLKELILELSLLKTIILKRRVNTSDSEMHIDG